MSAKEVAMLATFEAGTTEDAAEARQEEHPSGSPSMRRRSDEKPSSSNTSEASICRIAEHGLGWRCWGRRNKAREQKTKCLKGLISRAKVESARPASKASRMLRFSPTSLYFLILEKDWWFCSLLATVAYCMPVVLLTVISLPLNFDNSTEEADLEYNGKSPSQAALAFRFCAANVISMGFGTVYPTSNGGYFLATLQQLIGIFVNVFVFAAVLAKFQSPRGDIVFSKQLCFFTRDSVRHVAVRLGNLRCHTLFNPSIKLYFLTDHETMEGETFVNIQELALDLPGTVSGVYTITHRIDAESPLYRWKKADYRKQVVAFQCTFTALDPVYKAEVCAKTTYNASQLHFDSRFKDMMTITNDGRPVLDFCSFEELVSEDAMGLPMVSSEEPPMTAWPRICLVTGYGRTSYGDPVLDGDLPRSPLSTECPMANCLMIILEEAGEEYDEFKSDSVDKPDWLKELNPKLEVPVCRLAGSDEWLAGTDDIIDTLVARSAKVGALSEIKPGGPILDNMAKLEPHYVAFALAIVRGKPSGVRSFLLPKFGVDPEASDINAGHTTLQKEAKEVFGRFETALEGDKAYLCGDRPGLLDCRLVTKLFLAYQFAESGLSDFGTSFVSMAPRTFAYLQRFTKRDSWRKTYGPGRGVADGQLDLPTIRMNAHRLGGLCPELMDAMILPALDRARRSALVRMGSLSSRSGLSSRRSTTDRTSVASLCL